MVTRGLVEASPLVGNAHLELATRATLGRFVAQLDGQELAAVRGFAGHRRLLIPEHRPFHGELLARRNQLVKRRYGVIRSYLTGVFLVVGEVLVSKNTVLVTNQPEPLNAHRIELKLKLHVLGNGYQSPRGLFDQHLARLGLGVDIGVVPVTLVRQFLERTVLVVARPEPENAQEYARLGFILDQLQKVTLTGDANIEVPIGRKNHAIDATLDEALLRLFVRQLDPLGAVGGASRLELSEGVTDDVLAIARSRRKDQPRTSRVHHEGDAIPTIQLAHQELESILEER